MSAERKSVWVWVAVAAALVIIANLLGAGIRRFADAGKNQPKNDIIAIHPVAEKWVSDHDGGCPTVPQLKAEKELSGSSKIDDPWGSPYRISCDGLKVTMHCDGPDRRPNTADDLHYP